jgi:hypothetical protein
VRGTQKEGNPDAPPIHPELDAVWVSLDGIQLSDQAVAFQIFFRTVGILAAAYSRICFAAVPQPRSPSTIRSVLGMLR